MLKIYMFYYTVNSFERVIIKCGLSIRRLQQTTIYGKLRYDFSIIILITRVTTNSNSLTIRADEK